MRFVFLVFAAFVLWQVPALADSPPRLAVIPYVTLNLSPDEERELREALSIEIASGTSARVLSSKEVQKKLSPIPDGCPEDPACVASVGAPLGADYLLFVALIKNDTAIELQLFLTEVEGTGSMRQAQAKLSLDESTWSETLRETIRGLFGGVKRLALKGEGPLTPIDPTTKKGDNIKDPAPKPKAWPWLAAGGGVLLLGGASAVFFLYPFTSIDSFGPGVD